MKLSITCAFLAMSTAALAEVVPTVAPADDSKKLESTANDVRKGEENTDGRRYLLFGIETAAVFGISAGLYYATPEMQKQDWVLGWDTESWHEKLTLEAVRFDANPFAVNAFGHSSQAVLGYGAARGNGLGMGNAVIINTAASVLWEFFVEFRENPSINDMVVNSVTGPALGEPMWQVGDYFRSSHQTTFNEAMAAFFQPFDEIERRVNHRKWRESARPWHRFRVGAGTASSAARTDAAVDVDLEVVSFDHSGAHSGWTPAGGWSRIAGGVRFGDGIGGGHLESHTSYGGYQSRAVYENGLGRSAFIGFGTGITYESSNLGMETDQMAAYHLIGPQVDLRLRTATVNLRWQSAAYGDLGYVHAYALGAMPPIDAEPPFESTLTGYGYYIGVGATAWTRVLVDWQRWHADLEAHGHQFVSLDKRNSDRGEPEPPHDLADGRVYGKLSAGYELLRDRLDVDGVVDLVGRRGTGPDVSRTDTEQRYGVMLTLKH